MISRGCRSPVSVRPFESTTAPKSLNDSEHLLVQETVRGKDVGTPRVEGCAIHVRNATARFGNNQRAGGHIPRLQITLPETVHPSCGDVTQIDRRGSEAPHGSGLPDEGAKQPDDLLDAAMHVVGK